MARGGQLLTEGVELGAGGERAEPEQVGALFEGGALGEFVDINSTIGEDAGIAVNPTDAGRRSDDAFKTLCGQNSRHADVSLGDFDSFFIT